MEAVVRRVTDAERERLVDVLELAAGRHPTEAARRDGLAAYDVDRTLGIFVDDVLVGGGGFDLLELTVPGPAVVPAARAMLAGVLPTHRGRGLMRALLARQLRDQRETGALFVVATTWVPPLPLSVGFGPATTATDVTLELGGEPGPSSAEGDWHLLDPTTARRLLPGLFDRHRRHQPGQVSRTDVFWDTWAAGRPVLRLGEGERFVVAHRVGADWDGYLSYRVEAGALRDQPVEALMVDELIVCRPSDRLSMWSYVLGFDQARNARVPNVPPDDPLPWALRDRRRWRVTRQRDFLWLRVLDVEGALAARTYAAPGRLVLEVRDDVLAENARRFLLDNCGQATVAPTGADPDLVVGVAELAGAYLGATTFSTLALAGRGEERTAGALAAADRMFASPAAPWTVTDW